MHHRDVTMGAMASLITSLTSVHSTVHSGTDERKHQSSASLVFVWGNHRSPVNSPHKGPVTQKMFPFDDVIMEWHQVSFQSIMLPFIVWRLMTLSCYLPQCYDIDHQKQKLSLVQIKEFYVCVMHYNICMASIILCLSMATELISPVIRSYLVTLRRANWRTHFTKGFWTHILYILWS